MGSRPRLQRWPARLRLELQHLLGKSIAVLIHGALSPPRQLISPLASSPPLGQRNGPRAGVRLCQVALSLLCQVAFHGLTSNGLCFILGSFEAANVRKCQCKDQLSLSSSFQDILKTNSGQLKTTLGGFCFPVLPWVARVLKCGCAWTWRRMECQLGPFLTRSSRGADPLPRSLACHREALRKEGSHGAGWVAGPWLGALTPHRAGRWAGAAWRGRAGGRSGRGPPECCQCCTVGPWPAAALQFQQGSSSLPPRHPQQRGSVTWDKRLSTQEGRRGAAGGIPGRASQEAGGPCLPSSPGLEACRAGQGRGRAGLTRWELCRPCHLVLRRALCRWVGGPVSEPARSG